MNFTTKCPQVKGIFGDLVFPQLVTSNVPFFYLFEGLGLVVTVVDPLLRFGQPVVNVINLFYSSLKKRLDKPVFAPNKPFSWSNVCD
jgi:hypothetical protein